MSRSSVSSNSVEPGSPSGSPSDDARELYCDEVLELSEHESMTNSNDPEESEQQSTARVPQDSEETEQQSTARVPQDSEETEQQSKANPHVDSGSGLLLSSRLPAITNAAESSKGTIPESQTLGTELGPADPHSCADVADCDQQGVRVFSPRDFSFQELLDSNAAECLNSDWGELGAPSNAAPPSDAASSNAAPSDAAANEVEKEAPDHNNDEWKDWLNNSEGDE